MKKYSLLAAFLLFVGGLSVFLAQFLFVTPAFASDTRMTTPISPKEHAVQSNKPATIQTPPAPELPQMNNPGILNFLASATSYALTLGDPVHFDNPQKGFSRAQVPQFTISVPTKAQQDIGNTKDNIWQTKDEFIQAYLINSTTKAAIPVVIKKLSEGKFSVSAQSTDKLQPGSYHLSLAAKETFLYTRDLTQDFSWGVLAINTNKSIYSPHETAHLSFGVVDNFGSTICNATLSLTITDPQGVTKTLSSDNGQIKQSGQCSGNTVTQLPDYLGTYQTESSGYYQMVLTAKTKNGTHTLSDYFQVQDTPAFSVDRSSFPTRVYPLAAYNVKIAITANEDYNGPVTEYVPKAFYITNISDNGTASAQPAENQLVPTANQTQIQTDTNAIPKNATLSKLDTFFIKQTQTAKDNKTITTTQNPSQSTVDHTPVPITWQVHFHKGQTYTLSYTINFPPVSPEFYVIGPLTIGKFQEVRPWEIASDATKCWAGTAGANWSAASGSWVTTTGTGTTLATGDVATFDPGAGTCSSGAANTNSTVDTGLGFSTISGINIKSTYTQTITDNLALTVSSGNYAQAGGTWSGGSVNMTVTGTFTLSGGTFNATSGTLDVQSTYNTTGGTFVAGTGTIVFDVNSFTITPSTETYNNVTFNSTSTCNNPVFTLASGTTVTVNGVLKFASDASCQNFVSVNGPGAISAKGDISLTSTLNLSGNGIDIGVYGNAVVTVNGTGTQTMTGITSGTSGQGSLPSININKASGTFNVRQFVTETTNWTWTAGTVDYTGSTVDFDPVTNGAGTVTPGSTAFNNVEFDVSTGCTNPTLTMASGTTLTIAGSLTLASTASCQNYLKVTGTGGISAQGNINATNTVTKAAGGGMGIYGDAVITVNGTGTQTLTGVLSGVTDNGSMPSININKSAGTFNIRNYVTESTNWTWTAGTVDYTGSTVEFEAWTSGASTITPGSTAFNNVTFEDTNCNTATYTMASSTTLTVAGTLSIPNSQSGCNGATINGTGGISAQGNISLPGTVLHGNGSVVITINGTGTQTMTGVTSGTVGQGNVPSININKASGTLNVRSNITETKDWTWTAGTVDYTGSTVFFQATQNGASTITPGATAFNNVTFDDNSCNFATYTVPTGSTLTVAGTFLLQDTGGGCNGPKLVVSGTGAYVAQGNITTSSPDVGGGTAPITLSGTAAQTITQTTGDKFPTGTFTINKSSGTATAATALSLNGSGQGVTVTSGTLDMAGFNLTVNSAYSQSGGTLKLQGGETVTLGSTSLTGGTVNYYGSGTYTSLKFGNTYYGLTISGAGTFTANAATTVNGTFTQSAGTFNAPTNLTVGGNLTISGGTFTEGNNTITFIDNTQTSTITGITTFYNLTSITSGKTIDFTASTTYTVNNSLTLRGNSTSAVFLRSTASGTQWNLTIPSSGTTSLSYLDVKDSNACSSATVPVTATSSTNSGNNSCWNFPGNTWYNSNWGYRTKITINHTKVTADQTNFPALISWTSNSSLSTHAQTSGNDILFTQSDGITKLNHEIEKYVTGTGELEAWVQIPSLSSTTDTIIYMYYGNASAASQQNKTGTWDANYVGVWHLGDNAANTTVADSTSNANTGTSVANTSTKTTAGQIDGALTFNGSTDHITAANTAAMRFTSSQSYTISAWVNTSSLPGAWSTIVEVSRNSAPWYGLWINSGNNWAFGGGSGGAANIAGSAASTGWHYLVGTQQGGVTRTLYVDGVSNATGSVQNANGTGGLEIGDDTVSEQWSGSIDEVRLSSTNRSATWIQTEYNNQSSPSTFITVASAQSTPSIQIQGGVKFIGGSKLKAL